MDIIKIYQAYNVPFKTSGHKHCRSGWVQTKCCFCTGNPGGWHLGYCIDPSSSFYGRFVCWRCGGKGIYNVLSRLLYVDKAVIPQILKTYQGEVPSTILTQRARVQKIGTKRFKFPAPLTDRLPGIHRKYLKSRNFDPDRLQSEWEIKATGLVSRLDDLDFSRRIIVPITDASGEVVSYQGRDATGHQSLKYLTCPMEREKLHHKHLLFGLDRIGSLNSIVLVEGVFDVIRMGAPAVCGFGIKLTVSQIRQLAQFRRVAIAFDPDPQAWEESERIAERLKLSGCQVIRHQLKDKDPADMSERGARSLIDWLAKKFY